MSMVNVNGQYSGKLRVDSDIIISVGVKWLPTKLQPQKV